jgi:hypothetical protein
MRYILIVVLFSFTLSINAQQPEKNPLKSAPADSLKADTLKRDKPSKQEAPKAGQIKPYREVITEKAVSRSGMITVHKIDERYFFEIPDTIIGRDILVVNRISKSPAGMRPQVQVYSGDQVGENVIRFEKGPSNRIFIKRMMFQETSADSSDNGMYRSLIRSSLQPIAASFNIKAFGGNSTKIRTTVIDVTDFIQSENELLYFSASVKKGFAVGAVQADKSYIDSIRTYPLNTEIRTVRTYSKLSTDPNSAASTLPVTYELNTSLVLLPKVPMKARMYDDRVGYFARGSYDFDSNPQGVKEQWLITRWRLEPKPEDRAKYLRGELVEPAKPIIFYIDPATPKKWVPYLIAGVNDWQKAFEQAGFKNAIKALPAPENDPTWSMEDARHNIIVYKPSAIANASGPHVHDPRSGEIIESHVNWYHNIMQLLRNWYMIQAGAIDPGARKLQLDDELMGQLIRFVSSHEVGHTLGLRHNFGSSSTVPVEKLRDRAWLEKNGHTPSIMDYARFNYVAQPEDKITRAGIFPRIGDYDKWAIEWGYKWLPQFKTAEDETAYSNKLIIERLKNKRLFFGSENESTDPRSQSEDLGDDPVLASEYGMKNLRRIMPQLREWTREENEGYTEWGNIYVELLKQYRLYNAHVLKVIGGSYVTPKSVEQSGPVFEPVEYSKQKVAMKFLTDNVFNTPEWLISDTVTAYTGNSALPYIYAAQQMVLFRLLGSGILQSFAKNQSENKKDAYGISEFLSDLKTGVWSELYTHKPIDMYRRNLQKNYLVNAFNAFKATNVIAGGNNGNGLIIYVDPDPTRNDVSSIMRAHLLTLKEDMQREIARTDDDLTKFHLQDLIQRIERQLEEK